MSAAWEGAFALGALAALAALAIAAWVENIRSRRRERNAHYDARFRAGMRTLYRRRIP